MNNFDDKTLISQVSYAKKLRPLLPAEAFVPDRSKLVILLINLGILILGWALVNHLARWPPHLLWLYLPLAVVMANSVIVLQFSSHDLMHGSVIRNPYLIRIIGLLGLTVWWMPPTLWKTLHNHQHHSQTNSLADPDRNYLYEQPNTFWKWFQNILVPSVEVNPILLGVGMVTISGLYALRNVSSVLLFNREAVDYLPASFAVSAKDRRAIAYEVSAILMIHLSILAYLQFDLLKIGIGYFLPIGLGYAGWIAYIYTNHMLCRMTSVNDPLVNTVSLRVPQLVDRLHLNFSHHTEHHIFPGMSSDYYPRVRELLELYYPERFNLLGAGEAWCLLLQTPRHYKNENTFTDWSGEKSVNCPFS